MRIRRHFVTQRRIGYALLAVYGLAVFLANWMIRHVGTPIPGGTHLLPVGFGLMAPSGTYAAAVVLVARDLVQRTIGRRWSLVVILPGVALTALMDVHLALASATAFALSELADYAVYTPLVRRGLVRAVFASALVGAVVDSLLFLSIAGIPLAIALPGLLVGKAWVAIACALALSALRPAVARLRVA
jgi:uncharacterized PurR-regulated membrane protein YhhQ (DUF165 family)